MNRLLKLVNNSVLLIFLLFLAGCQEIENDRFTNTKNYFDLKGLLEAQILLLDSLQPSVSKVTSIDGVKESQTLHLDSAAWAKEMEIFFEADINDPILKDAYDLEKKELGDSLTLMSYEAIDKESAEIEFLKVFYSQKHDVPSHITAVFTEKNSLYDSKRSLKLDFQYKNNLNVLSGYSIDGIQKMLLKDTIHYKVRVKNLL